MINPEDEEYMKSGILICHVPQNIHVSDDSIKNIELGKTEIFIFEKCFRFSMYYDFIESLPKGFETRIEKMEF